MTRRLPIPQPTLLVGPGSSARLGQAMADFGHRRVLVVTDALVSKLGLAAPLIDALARGGAETVLFDEVLPDAPIPMLEAGITRLKSGGCDAVVAIGGGSVIDAAKAIALSAASGKHPRDLVGYFRSRRAPLPIYAVPTTAGTGSEVTVAAVISDPDRGLKLVIADTRIVPEMAALDPCLMTGLPPAITAATGMDALTHAVEAYIGQWSTAHTDRMALAAAHIIFEQLPVVYRDGANLAAREQMALASTYAGLAFTRANVGNVHALAHQLGGRYHTPHGLANAMLLPGVLRFGRDDSVPALARLALRVGLGSEGEAEGDLADRFIDAVAALNDTLGIPRLLPALRLRDIPALAEAACAEADANYPVPRRMDQSDAQALLRALLPPKPPRPRAAKAADAPEAADEPAKATRAAAAAPARPRRRRASASAPAAA